MIEKPSKRSKLRKIVTLKKIATCDKKFSADFIGLKNEGKIKQTKIISVGLTNSNKIKLD